jgi:Zn-dependent oligopeptidase
MEQPIPKFDDLMKKTKEQLACMVMHNLRDWSKEVTAIDSANKKLSETLKEVSGCHEKHNTPKLCDGCLISISKALAQ